MSAALPGGLTARMALSAHGWAAVIDGVLNINTVSDSRKGAAFHALRLSGIQIVGGCTDPDCGCIETAFAQALPRGRLVQVAVEAGA